MAIPCFWRRKARWRGWFPGKSEDLGAVYPHRGQRPADGLPCLLRCRHHHQPDQPHLLQSGWRRRCAGPEAAHLCVPLSGGQQRDLPHWQYPARGRHADGFPGGKPIGRDIDTGFSQTTMVGGGYDHCFVIDRGRGASQSLCAWASSDKTGISMKVYTTQPGVQLYTGNFLQDCPAPGKRRADAEIRRLCAGDPALPLQPLPPGVSLHRPAGRESVPRQHHPAVLHRQTVRETVKCSLSFKA